MISLSSNILSLGLESLLGAQLPVRTIRTCVPEKAEVKNIKIIFNEIKDKDNGKKQVNKQKRLILKSTVWFNSSIFACVFELFFF